MAILKQIKDMISDNKQLLLGGIAGGLIYYGNYMVKTEPWYPIELKQQLEPHLPSNGDLLSAAAPPAILYSIVKFGKKQKLKGIADGSIYFGVPTLLARTIVQTAWTEGKPKVSLARFNSATSFAPSITNMSKYIANNVMPRTVVAPSGLSKYAVNYS